jgi:hypothetical protein
MIWASPCDNSLSTYMNVYYRRGNAIYMWSEKAIGCLCAGIILDGLCGFVRFRTITEIIDRMNLYERAVTVGRKRRKGAV